MRSRLMLVAVVPGLILAAASGRAVEAEKPTFWVIPHTHWEGAVFKTREEYLETGLPHILMALKLLKQQPGYRFVLDQVAYVRPFLERFPEEEAAFRRFVAEGRLQLVGGMDVMPDVNMPGGESRPCRGHLQSRHPRQRVAVLRDLPGQLGRVGSLRPAWG